MSYTIDQLAHILNGPHAEIFKQYVNGATVEVLDICSGRWMSQEQYLFYTSSQYRIKPKVTTIKYRRYLYHYNRSKPVPDVKIAIAYESEDNLANVEFRGQFIRWIDNDWVVEEVEHQS